MDGQVFSSPLQSRRFIFTVLLWMVLAGLLMPAAVRAQAMGKVQVDTVALAHVDPPSLPPMATGLPAVATHELVALAGDPKIGLLAEKSAADEKPATAAKLPDPDAAKPSKAFPSKAEMAGAAAAPTEPIVDASTLKQAPHEPPAPTEAAPHASAIESSLIKPSVKEPTSTVVPPQTSLPPVQPTLYARFNSVAQVAAALLVVVGLIFLGRAVVRKYVPGAAVGAGKGVMEILARYPLAKSQSLVLVRIGSQLVVLNQTRDSSQSVLVIHDAVEVANILGQIQGGKPGSIRNGFSNLLANARMDLEATPPGDNDATIELGDLDSQLDEMAAAKRQLMELRQQVRSVRESLPIG